MEGSIICTAIKNAWIPIALLLALATVYLAIKRRIETDYLEKDRIESKIRHLAVALIIIIVTSPLWEFAIGNGVLPFECTPATQITTSTHTIRTFSDGSSEKNIRFITGGGFNSDASFRLPYEAKSRQNQHRSRTATP